MHQLTYWCFQELNRAVFPYQYKLQIRPGDPAQACAFAAQSMLQSLGSVYCMQGGNLDVQC